MPNMEVALTRRAPPVLDHPHINPSGICGGTATGNKVSVARCEGAHLDPGVQARGLGTVWSERTTFQAGMCMKTKRRRCQVSGARFQAIHHDPELLARGLGTVRSERTTFQAGMCMKRKVQSPGFGVEKPLGVVRRF